MSLYRKYRPKIFAEIAGQEHIKTTLQNEIALNSTVHAYVFSGPRAVGKTTTARIFVRALNCEKRKPGESEPCNTCGPCSALLENRTLDMMEIDAASHTGVDNVRENIIAAARVANADLTFKAFIIDEAHMLSNAAFNALLKLMEEPPTHVVFILATTEIHKVPATVVSRCQRFDFKKIPADQMEKRLNKLVKSEMKEIDPTVIEAIIRLSEGCERDAESLLGQVLSLDERSVSAEKAAIILPRSNRALVEQLVKNLFEKKTSDGMKIVEKIIDEGVDLIAFTDDIIDYLRSVLLIQCGLEDLVSATEREKKELERRAKEFSEAALLSMIEYFATAQKDSRFFAIKQLPLEVAIVKSCAE
ncbi:DNA polymerase III subunit gamma/tau [Candidatus Uhrbacteria bacterium]|nr:DNA polymerase III subunit gamma/tau [Candidatus Uhrbacteria bacterium]